MLKKIRAQQIERICAHANIVYDICSDYEAPVEETPEEDPMEESPGIDPMEKSPEEDQGEQVIVQGRCKRFCGLKREIRRGKKI